jgi:putative nucleotidyltransferase with HDIG domain
MSRARLIAYFKQLERTDYVSLALIAAGLAVAWLITYATGGSHRAFPHTFYVPVIYSAYRFGIAGGALTGALAMFVCGPIMPLNTTEGTMQPVSNWVPRGLFFIAIGSLAGQGFETLRDRLARSEKLHEDAVRAFVKTIDAKSPYTARHSERVADLTVAIGTEMQLDSERIKELRWAALLHDVGKLWVPDYIINKPGRLTVDEWEIIRGHPIRSEEFIKSIEEFQAYATAARNHHERYDGRGYPDGLRGTAIPEDARILAVADAFEAMTSDRPYRPGLTFSEAITELRAYSGHQFDPEIVAACIRAIESRPAMLQNWRTLQLPQVRERAS